MKKTNNVLAFCLLLFFLIFSVPTNAEINIVQPANDNPPAVINSDLDVSVFINDTNVKYAQVRVIGYPWLSMDQVTNSDWTLKLKISDYSAGEQIITAKYLKIGETVWQYVNQTVKIIIQKPSGSVEFTVKDKNDNPVSEVIVYPDGNKTDSSGKIKIVEQPFNTDINFTFSKDGYIKTYQHITLSDNTLIQKPITITKENEKKELEVTGYSSAIEAPGMFYVKVKDSETGDPVNGAQIMLYQGNVVKSIAGETVNGGRLTVSFNTGGYFEMVVSKDGYEEWSEGITVLAPMVTAAKTPVPTPTPSPTPIPTPTKKIRSDVCEKLNSCDPLTDDEYRELLAVLERKTANETKTNTTTIPVTTTRKDDFPYPLILGMVICGVVIFKYKDKFTPKKNQIKTTGYNNETDNDSLDIDYMKRPGFDYETRKIKCDDCDWKQIVDKDLPEEIITKRIEEHRQKEHQNN